MSVVSAMLLLHRSGSILAPLVFAALVLLDPLLPVDVVIGPGLTRAADAFATERDGVVVDDDDGGGRKIRLDEDLFHRALAHAVATTTMTSNYKEGEEDDLVGRLRRHDAEALYEVARSMNSHGDRLSSVLIWHALADDGSEGEDYYDYDEGEGYDYTGHVPSAMALGFSYYEVDKPRSLRYFLMATSKEGKPHQAGMYNAGRLYLELGDPSSALAYMRACATLDRTHPAYARPQLGMTCRRAYHELSSRLIAGPGGATADDDDGPGLEEAVECFAYADIDDFPRPGTGEFRSYRGAVRELEEYAKIAREASGREGADGGGGGDRKRRVANAGAVRARGSRHLTSAFERLIDFQSQHRGEMSKLQVFLVGYILERIQNLINRLEVEGIESDEL